MEAPDAPRCANQMHVREADGRTEPTVVCSCAAGLIHMNDCPVTMGLDCLHFRPAPAEPPGLAPRDEEALHARLMEEYLSRAYFHRVRSLAPAGDPWFRRRTELYAFYATVELEGEEPGEDDEGYERERERLLAQRRKWEEARRDREERSREERAKERARLGIKTVVEKAQEAVADRGNVASSFLDDVKLPAGRKRRSRRRRKGPGAAASEGKGKTRDQGDSPPRPPGPAEGQKPARKRRRRRRRRGGRGDKGGAAT